MLSAMLEFTEKVFEVEEAVFMFWLAISDEPVEYEAMLGGEV